MFKHLFKVSFICQTVKPVLIEVRKDYMIWPASNSLVMFHYNFSAAVNNTAMAL